MQEKTNLEFNKIPSERNFQSIKQEILEMLKKNNPMENELTGFFTVLQNNENDGQASCQTDILEKGGKEYDVFFTNTCEVMKHKHINGNSQLVISDITEIFRVFEEIFFDDEDYGGLVINPYGENPLFLERNDLKEILDRFHFEIFGEEKEYPAEFSRKNFSNDYPDEFTRKHLSNELLTKKFFADARFIHTSASGAMGDAGVFEVWNKNFEHYRCQWTGNFDVEKFHEAFMKDEDTPYFNEPVKNGWCFHYMGCGHNFYIKEEFNAEYLKKFDEGLKNGKNYPRDEDVFPVEEIMSEILRNQKN